MNEKPWQFCPAFFYVKIEKKIGGEKMTLQLPKEIYAIHGPKAVLLLHAYSGSSNDVRMLARFLERENYTVYAPIFSGHGTLRPEDILESSPENWEKEAFKALEFLKAAGFEEIYVFGLSMGGIFATLLLESQDKALKGGGTFSSPIYPVKENHVLENFLVYAKKLLTYTGVEDSQLQQRLSHIKEAEQQQLAAIQSYSLKAYENLDLLKLPFFLGQSGQDELIPATACYLTVKKIIEENQALTFHWYQKASHVLTVSVEKNKFQEDVLNFLKQI